MPMKNHGPPRAQPKPKPRNEIPSRNPPEAVEHKPDPPIVGGQGMPTPPGYVGGPTPVNPKPPRDGTAVEPALCSGCNKPLDVLGTIQGEPVYGHKAFSECSQPKQAKMKRKVVALETALGTLAIRGGDLLVENNALQQDAVDVLVVVSKITAELERIPCMSEDCDGPEDGVPDARDGLPNTRCHRCAAVRLARSAIHG